MSCVKRAFYSVFYHKGNNLLLFGIFTLILTLVLSSICVREAAEKSITQIGKSVDMSVQVIKHKEDTDLDFFSLQMAKEMEKLPQVKKSSFLLDTVATAYDFKPYFDADRYAFMMEVLPQKYSNEWEDGHVTLVGITDTSNYWFFLEDGFKLLEGRHLVKEDEGKPYALISKVLAEMNNLTIGDTINLQSFTMNNKIKEFEIVGIHSGSVGNTESYAASCNYIFTPVEFAEYLGPGGIKRAEYTLNNAFEAETFMDAAQTIVDQGEDKGAISFEPDNLLFLQASSAMQSLINVTNAILVSVIFMGGIILCLMVLYSMLGRFFEVGVLLSLGERRKHIALQMIIEVLLPLLPAILVSIVSSNLFAQWIGETLLGTNQSMQDITVLISSQSVFLVCVSGLLLAITACILPIKRIMKYQPKKLMQIME